MLAQAGAGVEHHRLTGFEQKPGQVPVGKRRLGGHLFNMLNEWAVLGNRVCALLALCKHRQGLWAFT
jgi:hypothetical protein